MPDEKDVAILVQLGHRKLVQDRVHVRSRDEGSRLLQGWCESARRRHELGGLTRPQKRGDVDGREWRLQAGDATGYRAHPLDAGGREGPILVPARLGAVLGLGVPEKVYAHRVILPRDLRLGASRRVFSRRQGGGLYLDLV